MATREWRLGLLPQIAFNIFLTIPLSYRLACL